MIMQEVWREGVQWDEPASQEIQSRWESWQVGLTTINMFSLPRCYKVSITSKLQLHVFGDASEKGYGAVAYLRTCTESCEVSFVAAKGRVAPTKPTTLPRLELSAATAVMRLYRLIIKEIDLSIVDNHFYVIRPLHSNI